MRKNCTILYCKKDARVVFGYRPLSNWLDMNETTVRKYVENEEPLDGCIYKVITLDELKEIVWEAFLAQEMVDLIE